jgi:hypothetical protein
MTTSALVSWFVDMRPKQAQKWMRRRSLGSVRFVLVYGLLVFGGAISIWNSALIYVFDHRFRAEMTQAGLSLPEVSPPDFVLHVILPVCGICLAGGVVFGALMWWLMEWQYRRYQCKSGAVSA